MKYNSDIHHRRSIRIKGYDYSQEGLYYITICTHNHTHLFGDIKQGEMLLKDEGRIAEKCLLAIPDHFPYAQLHPHVVMPNHVHCIIEITGGTLTVNRANNYSPLQQPSEPPSLKTIRGTSKTIGSIVRGYKIGVTKWFRSHTDVHTVWQRNYYEHIIRNEKSYAYISEYIQSNPLNWQDDKYYSQNHQMKKGE